MKKKSLKVLIAVAGAIMTQVICAKTVAWYHFDEGVSGEKTSGGTPQILNAVDPESLKGRPYAMAANSLTVLTTGNLLPVYTNVFPSCVTWRDPVTGKKGANNRGLFLDSLNHDGSGQAGVVFVDDDEKLHLQKLTVEMMVNFRGENGLKNWSHICMMRNGPGNTKAWGLHINANGTLNIGMNHFSQPDETGSVTTNNLTWSSAVDSHTSLIDGKWHHIAFSYDGSYVRLYVDYQHIEGATRTWKHGVSYSDVLEGRLCIGGNDKATYGRWLGFIDEVRISDEVLSPDKFLRVGGFSEQAAEITDEDTALYLSFDSAELISDSFFGAVGQPMVFNESIATNAPELKVASYDGVLPVHDDANTVSNFLNNGIFSDTSYANGGCWSFGSGETAGRSLHMYMDDYSKNGNKHLITSGNFTIEYWFKASETPSKPIYIVCEQSATKGSGTMLLYVNTNNEMFCRLVSGKELEDWENLDNSIVYNDAYKSGICDGKWHHIALSVDRTNKRAAFYVDYVLIKEHSDFVLASEVAASNAYKPLQISGGWGYGANRLDQFYGLSIDELRITRRALSPQEFLKAGAPGTSALEPTRMLVSFEGGYAALPRPDETLLKATTAGTPPTFSRRVPGNAIFDGKGNLLKASNTNSISFAENDKHGILHFSRNALLERDMQEQTVEFFMRAPKGSFRAWTHLLHLGLGDTLAGVNVWSIGYCGEADNGVSVRVDTDLGGMAAGEPGFNQVTYAKNIDPADGQWHHIAVTFGLHEETNTQVRIYKDYSLVGENVINGRLKMGSVPTSLNIGRVENANYYYKGLIDEVRISKGVLPVEDMMYADWIGRPFRVIVR